jgi:aminoglycoside phosphotransferase (APT) family kinase protein
VRSSSRRGVVHIAHARPRHWRECVLWMRLYGYDVRLVPYHAWLRQLDLETKSDRSHPLAPLRAFFLARPADAGGLTLPELMLRTTLDRAWARQRQTPQPDLDASLLQRYFDAFVARGASSRTARTGQRTMDSEPTLDAMFFSNAIGRPVVAVEYLGRLCDHSIISELTAWRSGRPTGLFHYRVHEAASRGARDVIVKIKPSDDTTIAVGEALSSLCGGRLGDAYDRWRQRLGFVSGHTRELAIYAQRDPRFTRHTPRVLGMAADPEAQTWTLVLERIRGAELQDSVDHPERWRPRHIERAIDGLAALHSIWFGRESELRAAPWIGYVPRAHEIAEMSDLWSALAAHAAPRFSAWADPAIGSIQRVLIDGVGQWWRPLETLPRTLVHNDFTPRNICLRHGANGLALCAYDWELAAVGVPQHDLAELMCFVLTPDASREEVRHWIDRHRHALERATGTPLDPADWHAGFRSALCDLMLNRLPMYALVHRVRPQSFLPRVVRTWRRIYEFS